MAYFACKKAARTGTDRSTRASIAKGSVSPTFKHRTTGKETLRGVVQLDIISGKNMDYVTSSSLTDRLASAVRINKSSKSASSSGGGNVSTGQVQQAELYSGKSGVIKTSKTLGLSKTVIVVGAAIVISLYMVLSK